jgi:hypothetical protein
MNIRMAAVAACIAALGGSPARADIIEADFTGVVTGAGGFIVPIGPGDIVPEAVLIGLPFTSTILFDTTKGTLLQPSPGMNELWGAAISASFSIPGYVSLVNWRGFSTSFLGWSDDGSNVQAAAQEEGFYLYIDLFDFGSSPPSFQFGTCPGRPCGALRIDSAVMSNLGPSPAPLAVPGPLAGAGLPGLAFAILAVMRMYRRKFFRLGW